MICDRISRNWQRKWNNAYILGNDEYASTTFSPIIQQYKSKLNNIYEKAAKESTLDAVNGLKEKGNESTDENHGKKESWKRLRN